MNIAGIDPGLSGSLFVMGTEFDYSSVFDMPTLLISRGGKNKRDLDIHKLSKAIAGYRIGHAFVEKQWAMAGATVREGRESSRSSVFYQGKGYGIILGILATLGVPFTEVAPATWKRALQVPASKDGARQRASQLLPDCAEHWPLKKHEARAEAALIALYGIRVLNAIASGKAA